MGTKTAYPGRLQCVGGGLSRQDLHGHNFDLEKSVLRELSEELGINKKDDIKDCCVKFIKTGGNYDFIAVLFHIELDMTLHQFQSRYEDYCYALKLIDENPEFQRIVVLENNPESIEVFIRNEKRDSVDYLYPFLQEMSKSNNGASLK
jgi:hypothetical protein